MSRIQTIPAFFVLLLVFDSCYSQNPNSFRRGPNSSFNNGQGNNFGNGPPNRGNSGPPGQRNDNARLSAQQIGMFGAQTKQNGRNPFRNQPSPNSWGNGNSNGQNSMSRPPFQPNANGGANQGPNQLNIEKLKLHLKNAHQRLQQNAQSNPNQMGQQNAPNNGNPANFNNPSVAAGPNRGNMNANMQQNMRNMQFQFQSNQQQNSNPSVRNMNNMNQQQQPQQPAQQQPQPPQQPPQPPQQPPQPPQQPPQQQQQGRPNGTMGRNAAGNKNMSRGGGAGGGGAGGGGGGGRGGGNVNKAKKNRGNMKRPKTTKPANNPNGMKLAPKKVSPRKFYWKTLFPSGTASEENAEVLYSTKLVLINSENAPTIDEFNKGGILMDFKRGMMAVRIDVVPSTGFPGMPFNGQRACFLLKNMTTFDQTVKELHTRGKTKRNLELGEMIHMVAADKNRLTGPEVRRRGGVFITRYCQDAINSNNVFLLLPEAAVEMSPKTFQVSGLVHAMEPLYPIPVNIAVEITIDFGPPPTMTPAMNFNPSTPGWGKGWGNSGGWG